MKSIFILLLAATSISAQTLSVKFYGTNTAGLPQYWPQIVQPGTNALAGFVLLTQAQLDTIIATNRPAYDSWESNKTYTANAALAANTARLIQLYNGIPDARVTLRNFANATNTLTTVQLTAAARQMADNQEKLMEFIQRLGPVLKAIYKPEEDSTQ